MGNFVDASTHYDQCLELLEQTQLRSSESVGQSMQLFIDCLAYFSSDCSIFYLCLRSNCAIVYMYLGVSHIQILTSYGENASGGISNAKQAQDAFSKALRILLFVSGCDQDVLQCEI